MLAGPHLAQLPAEGFPRGCVADLADHTLGLLGLDGCGRNDVVGRLHGLAPGQARQPQDSCGPESGDSQEDDHDSQERDTQPSRLPGQPRVELVDGAE